jgi:hypothetical protein
MHSRLQWPLVLCARCMQLNAMPLRVEIPSALRRKAELEGKVSKLEAALKVFSRPKVFVKL